MALRTMNDIHNVCTLSLLPFPFSLLAIQSSNSLAIEELFAKITNPRHILYSMVPASRLTIIWYPTDGRLPRRGATCILILLLLLHYSGYDTLKSILYSDAVFQLTL